MSQVSKPAGLTDEQWEVVRVARAGSYSDESARAVIQKLCSVVLELGARQGDAPLQWEVWLGGDLEGRFSLREYAENYGDECVPRDYKIRDREAAE